MLKSAVRFNYKLDAADDQNVLENAPTDLSEQDQGRNILKGVKKERKMWLNDKIG